MWILLLIAFFVYISWCFWHHERHGTKENERGSEAAELYVQIAKVYIMVIAAFLLLKGGSSSWILSRASVTDTLSQELEALLYVFWPFTARLQKQMYPCDRAVQHIVIPTDLDVQRVRFTEYVMAGEIFQCVNASVLRQPIQSWGRFCMWRSWFSSSIVRTFWPYQRAFLPRRTVRFGDTMLIPPPEFANPPVRPWQNPLVLAAALMVLVFIVLCALYLALVVPRGGGLPLFVNSCETFFFSVTLIALAATNSQNADQSQFEFQHSAFSIADTSTLSAYPMSVPWTVSMNRCNVPLQRVEAFQPDAREVERFNIIASRGFFQLVHTSLELDSAIASYTRRFFQSVLGATIARAAWRQNRRFWWVPTAKYIDDTILPYGLPCDVEQRGRF